MAVTFFSRKKAYGVILLLLPLFYENFLSSFQEYTPEALSEVLANTSNHYFDVNIWQVLLLNIFVLLFYIFKPTKIEQTAIRKRRKSLVYLFLLKKMLRLSFIFQGFYWLIGMVGVLIFFGINETTKDFFLVFSYQSIFWYSWLLLVFMVAFIGLYVLRQVIFIPIVVIALNTALFELLKRTFFLQFNILIDYFNGVSLSISLLPLYFFLLSLGLYLFSTHFFERKDIL